MLLSVLTLDVYFVVVIFIKDNINKYNNKEDNHNTENLNNDDHNKNNYQKGNQNCFCHYPHT